MTAKGESKSYDWLLAHVGYQGDDCLKWPFGGEPKSGRGALRFAGAKGWAHRLMCELAHGKPPTPKHTAAHECGKGHEGCVNPRHLKWKTQAENLEDCRVHGTMVRHRGGNRRRLTPDQVQEIKAARGVQTQLQLATAYGVSEGTISDIWHGRSHTRPSKIPHWSPEDDEKLKEAVSLGYTFAKMAKHIGRSVSAVTGRTYRLGLTSGRPATRTDYSSIRRPNT